MFPLGPLLILILISHGKSQTGGKQYMVTDMTVGEKMLLMITSGMKKNVFVNWGTIRRLTNNDSR